MANLMWFTEEDVLDAMLLESVDDQQLASPTMEEETMLLGKAREAQAVATHSSRCNKWVPEPKNAAKLMEAVTEARAT